MTTQPEQGTTSPPSAVRILGVYPQKQNGLFMQRIKILGGRIDWSQWRRVVELAAKHSGGAPLHVTTRQDLELHNIRSDDLVVVQERLAQAGLSVFGACGDTVRNVTVCAGCGLCTGSFDVLPLARLVRGYLDQQQVVLTLPRKFKISFSGCPKACAKPWLNDLGFVARPDGRFTLIGAGSLGPRPSLGIRLYEGVPAEDVLPTCLAAIELFNERGDRQNRRRARLRHVRESLGDEAFRVELDRRIADIRNRGPWPQVTVLPVPNGSRQLHRLQLPNGNLTVDQALRLADASEVANATPRIDLAHGVTLYGSQPVQLPNDLMAMTRAPVIVACPGCTTCPQGLADCWATADRIREAFSSRDLSNMRIHISGCPNNCAQSAVAPIGLIGMIRTVNGQPIPHYRLFTNGGNGTNDRLAEPFHVLPANDVPDAIKTLFG
jgi:sulfite reductase beta subunit-like hemoprotein